MAIEADDIAGLRILPRTLAGATVLQMVPSLHGGPAARGTIDIARALVHAGARAIVAGEGGPLIDELKSFGGEWLPFASSPLNLLRRHESASRLTTFIEEQRVDIIHAKTVMAASIALGIPNRVPRLVTDLPDLPSPRMRIAARYLAPLAGGDRVIARSLFHARPVIERYDLPVDRISAVPRPIDVAVFDPATVGPSRVAALRQAWGIPSGVRIALVPGRVSPGNGQMSLIEAASDLIRREQDALTLVLAGDDRKHPRYVKSFRKRARDAGVDPLFRIAGHVDDMPAAYAAADVVVVPSIRPKPMGLATAEAQAMAKPVIATDIGPLPELLLAPPPVSDAPRTGWLVPPGKPAELAGAIATALSLDAPAYRAIAACAREHALSMFAPERIAAATLSVYSALLESLDTPDDALAPPSQSRDD